MQSTLLLKVLALSKGGGECRQKTKTKNYLNYINHGKMTVDKVS